MPIPFKLLRPDIVIRADGTLKPFQFPFVRLVRQDAKGFFVNNGGGYRHRLEPDGMGLVHGFDTAFKWATKEEEMA